MIKRNKPQPARQKGREPSDKSNKARQFSRLRGMKDVLSGEWKYWELVSRKASDLAAIYGFQRIETPILERLELYERSSGKDSDVVSKEMYSFIDKSGDKVALRPEATPGLVRAYIEHGMFNLPQPTKLFSIAPLFRHEKPQAGRLRQHTQFDVEMFGEAGPVADAQVILLAYNFFRELQIEAQVQINSIGCKECRPSYIKKLNEYYKERGKRSKLCNDCKKRFAKNPLRLLDCKEEVCQEVRADAPQIVDSLCDHCRDHFIKVLEYLDELEIPYNLNPHLVRGLDYYTKTVFEITAASDAIVVEDGDGAAMSERTDREDGDDSAPRRQQSLGGGGRYDSLVELMGGRPTPACGFGVGLERVIMKIKENDIPIHEDRSGLIYIAQLGEAAKRRAFCLFEELRRGGIKVRQSFTKDALKNQLEDADRCGAKYSLIIGQKELLDGTLIVRDMESGTQETIDCKKALLEMNRRLNPDA